MAQSPDVQPEKHENERPQPGLRARGAVRPGSLIIAVASILGATGGRVAYDQLTQGQSAYQTQIQRVANAIAGAFAPAMKPRVGRIYQETLASLRDDPVFTQWARTEVARAAAGTPLPKQEDLAVQADGRFQQAGAQLAAKGLARLSADELLEMAEIKLKLSAQSQKVCAGFWSGGLSSSDLFDALDALPDDDVRRWFQLSVRATRLELQASDAVPRIQGSVMTDELVAMQRAMPPEQAESLAQTMNLGVSAPPSAACNAFKEIFRAGVQLPAERRQPFLLGFTCPWLVDW